MPVLEVDDGNAGAEAERSMRGGQLCLIKELSARRAVALKLRPIVGGPAFSDKRTMLRGIGARASNAGARCDEGDGRGGESSQSLRSAAA